jgi:alpha-L-fucosidase 2
MKIVSMRTSKILLTVGLMTLAVTGLRAQKSNLALWYQQPAQKWTDALPLGNGHIGAMIYGGIKTEQIQFNEATLWTGGPRNYNRTNAFPYLNPIRTLLEEGKQKEAEGLAEKYFMGLKDVEDSVYEKQKINWKEKAVQNVKYAAKNFDDHNWPQMELPTMNGWEQVSKMDGLDGELWFRTSFDLPASMLGKDLTIDLGRIRDLDVTYVNGHFIGSQEGNTLKRSYTIKAAYLHEGKNVLAVQVLNFFDKGGFTGVKENKKIFTVYAKNDPTLGVVSLPLVWKYYIENSSPPQFGQYQASYQPFGDLYFAFDHDANASEYKRTLDIANAISTVSYKIDGTIFNRRYFASNPDRVVVAEFTATKKEAVSVTASFSSVHRNYVLKKIDPQTIALYIQVKNGALKGVAYLHVSTSSGKLRVTENEIQITNADTARFYLSAATNFISYNNVSGDPEKNIAASTAAIKKTSYQQILAKHTTDYTKLFNRFAFQLDEPLQNIPTDSQIKNFNPTINNSLLALYVQYSRYLLLASSRENSLMPANLQGIWNPLLTPPWGSKYTTNINLEMNYWGVDVFNLSNLFTPLLNTVKDLSVTGKETAKNYYHAGGWVLHHNTDIWKGTAAINASNHGIWVTGGAWLSTMIWDHFKFTQDTAFLKNNYPIMRGAAQFFVDFLVKDKATGWYISTPSNSPENGGLVAGPTMDHQIIRELFTSTIAASKVLHIDERNSSMLAQKINNLAINQIGKYGQLQEWLQDKDDTTNKHRHVSHLWGVYPGTDITYKNKALMEAAKQSLLYRGDDGTGWSLAWKTNLWARFKDGNHALLMASKFLSPADADSISPEKGGVYKNLFDAHPPFQIDGNFGGAAGIAEMLVQSHTGIIELLPALPDALKNGHIKGICARGGFEIDMEWSGGKLLQAVVYANNTGNCTLQYQNKTVNIAAQKGKHYTLNAQFQLLP